MSHETPDKDRLKILLVGDMHLGVLPGHIPAALGSGRDLGPHRLGPAEAWRRVVQAAQDLEVHAVALAGDLVDGNNALFEAFGLLESGLRELAEAHIPVVAVAGNHDTEVLPRLARLLEGLHLLGPGGTWSSFIVSGPGGLEIRLTGWSFPRPHVETSPLGVSPPVADPVRPTFGLLHADLDQSPSRYAPVTTGELRATGYRSWFLGHTHKPDPVDPTGLPFYLGSVSGLHPGETGLHGPVLMDMDASGALELRRLPLAPLRWEHLAVDAAGLDPAEGDFLPQLLEAVQARARELGDELAETLAVGFRLRLTGATPHAHLFRAHLQDLQDRKTDLIIDDGHTVLFIDRIEEEIRLPLDLLEQARHPGPVGLLARRILVLEGADRVPEVEDPVAERERLLTAAGIHLAEVDSLPAFRGLEADRRDEETARRLAEAGRRALEQMIATGEADHAVG